MNTYHDSIENFSAATERIISLLEAYSEQRNKALAILCKMAGSDFEEVFGSLDSIHPLV